MQLSLDPLRPYLGALKWLAAVAILVTWAFYWHGVGAEQWRAKYTDEYAAHAATKATNAAVLQDLADKTRAVAKKAASASSALARYRTFNDERYEKAVHDAKQASADLRAGLRAGAVQLQPWWQCGAPGSAQGDAADIASGQDGSAELRFAGAIEDVSDGDWADAWIVWLQGELSATREQFKAAGCAVEAQP
ncbi:hypothetical protein [Pseudoxanthomonas winnipegensis]|uniref:Uncharacterized protein n=1 Tax=Pseudoxanthomonas winnipegensis TaxID=2480810 RepID=A0A4Q8LCK3_9GAMM|nr:hypothetical protein [Pseudoxanthomonas winnipegensis]TAA26573.1 hypothetical protein EA660_04900 [Pseudoxanthomonas winnipegensis]